MNTDEALRMLEAHREYAEKTKNFHNEGNFKDLITLIEQLKKESELLRSGYEEAVVDVESWAAYASDYFKEKWDLEGDLKAHRDILTTNRKV